MVVEKNTTNGAVSKRGVGSVETAMRVLGVLADAAGPMQLKEIAAAAGMPAAKVHRYMVSLGAAGMISQTGKSGRYDLGPLALRIGVAAMHRQDVVKRACEALADLRNAIHATCFVAGWSDRGPLILNWEDSRRPLTVIVETGSTMPLLTSATGRAFLAFMPAERTAPVLQNENPGIQLDNAAVSGIVAEVRDKGFGCVDGDFQTGIAALSFPLFDHSGQMVGAVSALGRAGEFDVSQDGAVVKALKAFVASFS